MALIAGLMLNVYYANAMVLTVLAVEAMRQYFLAVRKPAESKATITQLLSRHVLFWFVVLIAMTPTFVTRYYVYGSPFASGYIPLRDWSWSSPYFSSVLFSSNHGLLSWTPILLLAIAGLFIFWRFNAAVGLPFLAAFLAFYIFIACYPDWAGISSYGNRFFVSLTALFIFGLAFFIEQLARLFQNQRISFAAISVVLACLVLWNAGLIFQWGEHLIPARGPISFSEMTQNQFEVVPRQITSHLRTYFFRRKALMQQIEERDIQQMRKSHTEGE